MPALHAERGRQRREAQVERHELDLDAALLFLVGEGLAHAVGGRIGGIGKPDLVVLVVGGAAPEADGIDPARRCGRYSPLLVNLVSLRVDARLVSSPSMPGIR